MKPSSVKLFLGCVFSILLYCSSCVDDVDFDRLDEVVLTPRLDADLLFFTVNYTSLSNEEIVNNQIILRDTTQLNFLDDEVTQENLVEIEITYRATNSFNQSITNRSIFLSENGVIQYEIIFPVSGSNSGEPVVTEFTETVTQQELQSIRNSIQLANEVIIDAGTLPQTGELNLQSKAIYSLEFSDL